MMTKGLSKLQKEILILAYKNRRKYLSNREVLVKIYGFKPLVNINEVSPGALVFDREAIGVKRYQAASVSVARCFNRLCSRGLAEREYNRGIKLMDAGIKVAKEIKSN